MATKMWLGGASAVTQVDHLTPGGTIEADDKFIVTMTDENGGTSTISTAAGGTTVGDVCAAVQAALAASNNALFAAVTWTEDGSKIVGTAKVAGVPFYCTVATTEADDGAADDQTFVRSSDTANAGPNDWNTAANWSASGVPNAADDIRIMSGSHSILYGLETAGSGSGGEDFNTFIRGSRFQGHVGNLASGFLLTVGTINQIELDQSRGNTLLSGTALGGTDLDLEKYLRIRSVAAGTTLRLDGAVRSMIVTGGDVAGLIEITDSSTVGVFHTITDCPNVRVVYGDNITWESDTVLLITNGNVRLNSAHNNAYPRISGGTVELNSDVGSSLPIEMFGGRIFIMGSQEFGAINLYAGEVSFRRAEVGDLTGNSIVQSGGVLDLHGCEVSVVQYIFHGGVKLGEFAAIGA